MAGELKLIRIDQRLSRVLFIAAALVCVGMAYLSVRWHFANAVAPTYDRTRPESKLVADWVIGLAPSDPLTHYAAAVTFEKTFDVSDLGRSLQEYEAATAASPNNYLMWLSLGKARSLNGDTAGADTAFKRSLELAPNYAVVQWAYGNFLVRQDRTDEGFALMAKASSASPEYARSAAVTALQILDGNVDQALRVLGDNDATKAALQSALLASQRYDDAAGVWSRISDEGRQTKFREAGEKLAAELAAAKKFALAARVASTPDSPVTVGQIGNGGFENGVKLKKAGLFEWQIAEGGSPQIGLSESSPHAGRYSLVVVFNSFESAAFRSISQTVVVVPGAQYEIQGFYKSDVKTTAKLRWEAADASTTATIAGSEPLVPSPAWAPFVIRFTVPEGTDGVIIRFNREGCVGPTCPTNGTISFDDISLKRL